MLMICGVASLVCLLVVIRYWYLRYRKRNVTVSVALKHLQFCILSPTFCMILTTVSHKNVYDLDVK